MPEAVRRRIKLNNMSWFSKEEDYSIHDNGFYGEPEITYGPTDEDKPAPSASTSGAWDDYQHEREYISSIGNGGYSR